jgi:Bacterial regulatory proteins, luxR family
VWSRRQPSPRLLPNPLLRPTRVGDRLAATLFITLRTVEMHLRNAFRKLRISTRTQLPAALTSEVEPVAAGRT